MAEGDNGTRPLEGVRVVEMGSLLAGPFCGQLLADFGAEVIKLEPPGKGDPMRVWGRHRKEGRTLWWPIIARNKKSVTLNLREWEGQELARELISGADVVVENFRPGTMEGWVRSNRGVYGRHPARHRVPRSAAAARRGQPWRLARGYLRGLRGGDGTL